MTERPADGRVFTWTAATDVTPTQVEWWEKHLIPRGVLTLPVGRGNSGKSTTCAAWAAEATRRGELVVWLHSEEDRSMHIVPKLLAAQADLDLIRFLDVGVEMDDGEISEAMLQLPRDLDRLEDDLVAMGCRFVVLDALTSFKPSRMSANSGDDVRAFLEPIQRMAGRLNAVVLGIAHLGKDGERKARDSVKGASEWTDVPRQVLAFHREDDETEGVISDVKGNLSPSPRSIGYRFESVSLPGHGIDEVGRVVFTGDVDTTVDEARRSSVDGDADDVDAWLTEFLEAEPKKATEVYQAADANGYTKDQAKRAKKRLGVRAVKAGGPGTPWQWKLPDGKGSDGSDGKGSDGSDGKGSDGSDGKGSRGVSPGSAPFAPLESLQVTGPQSEAENQREQGSTIGVKVAPFATADRPTHCRVCNMELPKGGTEDVCEDCGDPAHKVPERAAKAPLTVVHDGRAHRGKEPLACVRPDCHEPLVHPNDRRDGFHTSKTKCLKWASKNGVA